MKDRECWMAGKALSNGIMIANALFSGTQEEKQAITSSAALDRLATEVARGVSPMAVEDAQDILSRVMDILKDKGTCAGADEKSEKDAATA